MALRDVPGRPTRDEWLARGGVPELHAAEWALRVRAKAELGSDPDGFDLYDFLEDTGASLADVARTLEVPYTRLYARLRSKGLTGSGGGSS